MGPHVLEYLEELHLSVGHEGMESYGDAADEEMGVVKFLEALNTPALTKLTISAANGLALDESYAYDDAPTPETLLDAQENGTDPFLLEPHLSALISRSGCIIRHLALSRVFVTLPELLSIVKLCPDIRSLHLNDALRWMRGTLINGLATRTDEDGRLLAPKLQHLVIESIDQSTYAGFPISAVLDMVDARWPAGSSDSMSGPVRVEVVHCPSDEYEEGTSKGVAQERMRSRLADTQARKDLQLVIRELERDKGLQGALETSRG
uniref:Expressed protein n=2 Tax=Schizophyllum commune (strain H4-8 / FGSC 9210) TaxID=578458 RepID=D8QFG9_SCHCM